MSHELHRNRCVQQDKQQVNPADIPVAVATAVGLSWQQRQAAVAAAAAGAGPALPPGFYLQPDMHMPGGAQLQRDPDGSSAAAFVAALAAAGAPLEGVDAEQQQRQWQGRLAGELSTAWVPPSAPSAAPHGLCCILAVVAWLILLTESSSLFAGTKRDRSGIAASKVGCAGGSSGNELLSLQAQSGLHGGWQHPATSGGASGLLQATMAAAQIVPAGLGQQHSLGGQPCAGSGAARAPACAAAAQQQHAQQHGQQQPRQSQPARAEAPQSSLLLELMARQLLQEQQAALQAQPSTWEAPPLVLEHPDVHALAAMYPSLTGQIRQLSQQLQMVQAQLAVALPAALEQQPRMQHPALMQQQQQSLGGGFTAEDVLAAFEAGKQLSEQPPGAATDLLALPAPLQQVLERAGWAPPLHPACKPGNSSIGGDGSFPAATVLEPDPSSLLEHLSATLQAAG
jgi:hypothetical protein